MNAKNFFLSLLLAAMMCVPFTAGAQVTIGSTTPPQEFSILELISNQGGLRLPQMTRAQRDIMVLTSEFQAEKTGRAMGLMIFNTNSRCVETWNGERWILNSSCPCGAYIAPGVWRRFMCHNLGADESLDPFTPHAGLHGAMFKWGTGIVAMTAHEVRTISGAPANPNWAGRGGTPPAGAGPWNMVSRPPNPCPPGFRVPTSDEWRGVINNNVPRRVGDWTMNNNPYPQGNFSSGIFFGDLLFLPATGSRDGTTIGAGVQEHRGRGGTHWSSTASVGANASIFSFWFDVTPIQTVGVSYRSNGHQVRCIAE